MEICDGCSWEVVHPRLMSEPHILTSKEGKEFKEIVLRAGGKSASKKYI